MMKKIITSPYRKMKILLVLPVFAIVFYSFAKPEYRYIPLVDNSLNDNISSILIEKNVKGIILNQDGAPLPGT